MSTALLTRRLAPAGIAVVAVAALSIGSPAGAHRDNTAADARTGTYTVTLLRVRLDSGPFSIDDGVAGPPPGVPLGPFKLLIHTITRAAGHDTQDAVLGPYRARTPRHLGEAEVDHTGINKVIYRHTDCTPFEPVVFRANASLLRDHGGAKGLNLPGGLSENPVAGGIVSDNGAATDPALTPSGESADTQRNMINRALTLPGSFPLPATSNKEGGVLATPGMHRIVANGEDLFGGPLVYEVRVDYVENATPCHDASVGDPPPYGPPPGYNGAPPPTEPGPAPNAPGPLGTGAQGAGGSTAVLTLESIKLSVGPFDSVTGFTGGPAKGVPRPDGRLLAHTTVRGGSVQDAVVGLPTIDTPRMIQQKKWFWLDFERVIYRHSSCSAPGPLRFASSAALIHHRLPTTLELATVDPGGIVSVNGAMTYPGTTTPNGDAGGTLPADIDKGLLGKDVVRLPIAPNKGRRAVLMPGRRYGILGTHAVGIDGIIYYVRYDVVPASLQCEQPPGGTSPGGSTPDFNLTQQAGYDHTVGGDATQPSSVCTDFTTDPPQADAAFTATLDPPGRTVHGSLDGSGHERVVFGIPAPGTYRITVVVGNKTSKADIVVPQPDADHVRSKSCAAPPPPS